CGVVSFKENRSFSLEGETRVLRRTDLLVSSSVLEIFVQNVTIVSLPTPSLREGNSGDLQNCAKVHKLLFPACIWGFNHILYGVIEAFLPFSGNSPRCRSKQSSRSTSTAAEESSGGGPNGSELPPWLGHPKDKHLF